MCVTLLTYAFKNKTQKTFAFPTFFTQETSLESLVTNHRLEIIYTKIEFKHHLLYLSIYKRFHFLFILTLKKKNKQKKEVTLG